MQNDTFPTGKMFITFSLLIVLGFVTGIVGTVSFVIGFAVGANVTNPSAPAAASQNVGDIGAVPDLPTELGRLASSPDPGDFSSLMTPRDVVWDSSAGIHTVLTLKEVQPFPDTYGDYNLVTGEVDATGGQFKPTGRIDLNTTGNEEWFSVPDGFGGTFAKTSQGCEDGMWMIRWRSKDRHQTVVSSKYYTPRGAIIAPSALGPYGFMVGSNCEEPLFRIYDEAEGFTGPTEASVEFEIRFWRTSISTES